MSENRVPDLPARIEALQQSLPAKQAKALNLKLLARAVKRLLEFAETCADCQECLAQLPGHIDRIGTGAPADVDIKAYRLAQKNCLAHLQKGHKLVTEDYYTSLYIGVGMAIGVSLGSAFHSIGMGIPIGLAIGVAIGAGLDADAKKKGLVI